jgi:hypothetical protein
MAPGKSPTSIIPSRLSSIDVTDESQACTTRSFTAEADRAFMRDVLGCSRVDASGGQP